MRLLAGKLRHRIRIEQFVASAQDPETGEQIGGWTLFADKVAAEISPVSAKELIAAQQLQSKVMGRIVIRFREGVVAGMRILHKSKIYDIQGVLTDVDSGLEYMTLPVSEGLNQG